MTKVLLYSKNKKNINKINKILENKGFALRVEEVPKKSTDNSTGISLIIFDVTEEDTQDKNYYKNFIEIINDHDSTKMIVLNSNQTKFLLETRIKFDDFVFYTNLEEELLARIKLILSKQENLIPKNSIAVGKLVLNLDKYELTVKKKLVELTFKEFELLKILLQNQNKVFTRNNLLSTVWGYDFYGGSRTVDVHMRRLRSKIDHPYDLMLKTVRNVGYMFSSQI